MSDRSSIMTTTSQSSDGVPEEHANKLPPHQIEVETEVPHHRFQPTTQNDVSAVQNLPVSRNGLNDAGDNGISQPETSKDGPQLTARRLHDSSRAHAADTHKNEYTPLAKSDQVLKRELRAMDCSATQLKTTVAHEPHFHQIHSRPLPKSTEQQEEEMMEYYKTHPFKASEVPKQMPSPKALKKRPLTTPAPFHFRSDERAATINRIVERTADKDDADLEECKKQFTARPMPNFEVQKESSPTNSTTSSKPKVTVPEPFHFRIDSRVRSATHEEEEHYEFHAKPVPETTYSPANVFLRKKLSPTSSMSSADSSGAPSLSTTERAAHRQQVYAEFRRRAEYAQREKELSWKQRKQAKHEATIQAARQSSPTRKSMKPFQLESDRRHEDFLREQAERLYAEQEAQRKQTQFHARPFKPTDPAAARRSKRPPTEPEPFPLQCVVRHEAFEDTRAQKLAAYEEEMKKQATFKAKPLPKYLSSPPDSRNASTDEADNTNHKNNKGNHRLGGKMSHASTTMHKVHPSTIVTPRDIFRDMPRERSFRKEKESSEWSGSTVLWLLCAFRILNVLLIDSYFDPDEFWQTREPAYCKAYDKGSDCPGFTWEWKRRPPLVLDSTTAMTAQSLVEQSLLGPVRTFLSVAPTYLFYLIVRHLGVDNYWVISKGPMILNAIIIAAPIDFMIWYSAKWLRPALQKPLIPSWCLFCSMSSWFHGYTLPRTYANGQESFFLIAAVSLLGPELLGNASQCEGAFFRACLAFLVGGMSVAIRFTSIAAFVPIGCILALRQRSILSKLRYLIVPCATFGVSGLGVALVVDYFFFGFWTLPFLGSFHFNVIQGKADLYGSHPWHWYFTSGFPAITGLLLPFLLHDLQRLVRGKGVSYGQRNLWIIVLSYLGIMSCNAHKEFRFILPVLPLCCLLAGPRVQRFWQRRSKMGASISMTIFVIANLIAVGYLGLFHQHGPIAINRMIVATALQQHQEYHTTSDQPTVTVHYLTGACHSTPLHSHLHSPPLQFLTWSLDCSPDCRADPDRICESEQFDRDVIGFIEDTYKKLQCKNEMLDPELDQEQQEPVCVASGREIPDFLVTSSKYVDQLKQTSHLAELGMQEIARFPHSIQGARVGDTIVGEVKNTSLRKLNIFSWLDVSVEEMILFGSYSKHTDQE